MPSSQNQNTTADRSLMTEKELNYVKDFLSWELLAMKKCNASSQRCTDPEIQQVMQKIGVRHQQHYDQLLTHLQ